MFYFYRKDFHFRKKKDFFHSIEMLKFRQKYSEILSVNSKKNLKDHTKITKERYISATPECIHFQLGFDVKSYKYLCEYRFITIHNFIHCQIIQR